MSIFFCDTPCIGCYFDYVDVQVLITIATALFFVYLLWFWLDNTFGTKQKKAKEPLATSTMPGVPSPDAIVGMGIIKQNSAKPKARKKKQAYQRKYAR